MSFKARILNAFAALRGSPQNVAEPGSSPTPIGTGIRTGTNVSLTARQLNEMTPYDRAQAMKDSNFVFNRLFCFVFNCPRFLAWGLKGVIARL